MDVRCSQCGVEYEFDEDKVRPSGVTVKCTSCGHVFKVKRPGPEESVAFTDAPDDDGWMVRHDDGTVTRFKELTTLQKWIVEQRVGPDDQISRSGRTWRPLGDIAELASFFDVVAAAQAAKMAASTTPAPAAPVPSADEGAATAARPVKDSSPDVPTPPPTELRKSPKQPALIESDVSDASFYGAALDDLDDEDPVLAWRRRARRRNAALLTLGLASLCLVAMFFLARPTFDTLTGGVLAELGEESPASTSAGQEPDALVARAEQALRARAAAAAPVVSELAASCERDDAPAAHAAALSRLHATRALRASLEVTLLQKLRASGVDPKADVEGAAKRAADSLAAAYTLASRARAAAPALVDADLAFATYQAAKGAQQEALADLASAKQHGVEDPRVAREEPVLTSLADAVAATDEAARRAALGRLKAAQAAAGEDARLDDAVLTLSALVAASEEDKAAARALIDAALSRDAADALATLASRLAGAPAPKASAPAAEPSPSPQAAAKASEGARAPADKPDETLGYDALLARADKERIRERTRAALALYKQAVDLRPRAAKPHVGMGWCHLDLDDPRAALDAFAYAVDLEGSLAEAHFGLGEAQRIRGQKAAALRSFKRYLELAPTGPDAPVARNAVKSLEEELK